MHRLSVCLEMAELHCRATMVWLARGSFVVPCEDAFGLARYRTLINFEILGLSKDLLLICTQGDIVLIGLREFQADKADIIHKYTTEEARSLQAYGELPATAKINQTAIDMAMDDGEGQDDNMGFDFEGI